MRSTGLFVALLALGCFSESPSSGGCVEGEAACDCRPDGTCIAEHECIASIDKCVPSGCTPGSESCTCVDGECLSTFVCDGGVCVTPSGATTGGDPSVASSISDTAADTGPTIATMDPTDTSPMTTDDPTIPPDDTSATDASVSMSGEVSTDPTMTDASASVSDSDTPPSCPECIPEAGEDVCEKLYGPCSTDVASGGCADLMTCMLLQQQTPQQCCEAAVNEGAIMLWNSLAGCAQDSTCGGTCDRLCLDG